MTLDNKAVFSRPDPSIPQVPRWPRMHTDAPSDVLGKGGSYQAGCNPAASTVPSHWASTFLVSHQPSFQMESYFLALECKHVHQKRHKIWRQLHWLQTPREGFWTKDWSEEKPSLTSDNYSWKRIHKTFIFFPHHTSFFTYIHIYIYIFTLYQLTVIINSCMNYPC